MLIQITNTCHMGCKHCMNNSTPEPQHMTMETWSKTMGHAKEAGVRVLLISGGEPTEHPNWTQIINEACEHFSDVIVPTNGTWINTDKEEIVIDILRKHRNCQVQITSVGAYYPLHEKTSTAVRKLRQRLKHHQEYDMRRIEFLQIVPCIDVDIHLMSLGRAVDHAELLEWAAIDKSTTTSCLMGALTAVQTDYKSVISIMEEKGHFCRPRINYKGEIGWSESSLCPNFASVFDVMDEVNRRSRTWKPCGKCPDYKKLLEHKAPKYVEARRILGINAQKVGWSV